MAAVSGASEEAAGVVGGEENVVNIGRGWGFKGGVGGHRERWRYGNGEGHSKELRRKRVEREGGVKVGRE